MPGIIGHFSNSARRPLTRIKDSPLLSYLRISRETLHSKVVSPFVKGPGAQAACPLPLPTSPGDSAQSWRQLLPPQVSTLLRCRHGGPIKCFFITPAVGEMLPGPPAFLLQVASEVQQL